MHEDAKQFPKIMKFARLVAALLSGALLFAGCAAAPVAKKEPVYFPAPPNEPRVQFLKAISGSKDVEPQRSKLELLVSGATERDIDRPIARPYGIQYSKGKLYVCDAQGASTVIIIDLKKKTFDYLKENPGLGKLKKPINLAVANDGSIYVADTIKKEIMVYGPTGIYVGSVGKEQGMKPVDVAVDSENIFVLDQKGNDIKVFDRKTREYLRSIGKTQDPTQGLALPTNFTTDDKGMLYVTNINDGSVKIFDKDGHFISKFGQIGDAYGEFSRPKGISVDNQHRIWVVDGAFQNVQVFNENHRVLMTIGDPPLASGALNLPAGIAVTSEDLDFFQQFAEPDFVLEQVAFVTSQMGNAMVSIYGLGHKRNSAAMPGGAEPKPQGAADKDGVKKPAQAKPAAGTGGSAE